MARLMRWLLLLTLMLAGSAFVVSSEGWMHSFGQKTNQEKATDKTDRTIDSAKSWTNWASENIPYFSSNGPKQTNDKLDASKAEAKDTASYVVGDSEKSAKTAAEMARQYSAKGLERMTSTKDQFQGATMGFIEKWGSWAKENVGKYYSYGPLAQKATEKGTDVVNNAASNVDSAADSTKGNLDTAEEEVVKKTDEKEL